MKLVVKTHLTSEAINNIDMFQELYNVLHQFNILSPDIAVSKNVFASVVDIATKAGTSTEYFAYLVNRYKPKIGFSSGGTVELDISLPDNSYTVRGIIGDLEVDIDFFSHDAFVDGRYSIKFEVPEYHWTREYLPEEVKQKFLTNP